MKDTIKTCRFCGKPVAIITWGVYRKIVVDAEAVMVEANPQGGRIRPDRRKQGQGV